MAEFTLCRMMENFQWHSCTQLRRRTGKGRSINHKRSDALSHTHWENILKIDIILYVLQKCKLPFEIHKISTACIHKCTIYWNFFFLFNKNVRKTGQKGVSAVNRNIRLKNDCPRRIWTEKGWEGVESGGEVKTLCLNTLICSATIYKPV